MDVHVITASKGGVGKTLISILLMNVIRTLLQNRQNTSPQVVLACDLNANNTSLYQAASGDTNNIAEYVFKNNKDGNYIVCRRVYPYVNLTAQSFMEFLSNLPKLVEKINTQCNVSIQSVIIDTNCHFLNIFDYDTVSRRINERLFIWFIWCYAQLDEIFLFNRNQLPPAERRAPGDVIHIGSDIEFIRISNHRLGRFVHTFSPASLGKVPSPALVEEIKNSWLAAIFGTVKRNPLDELLQADTQYNYDSLTHFINALMNAQNRAGPRDIDNDESAQEYLLRILIAYVDELPKRPSRQRPYNVIPIKFYQKLLGYTEAAITNHQLIDDIMVHSEIKVYQEFQNCYNKLMEHAT